MKQLVVCLLQIFIIILTASFGCIGESIQLKPSLESEVRYQFILADVDGNKVKDLVIVDKYPISKKIRVLTRLYGPLDTNHPYYRPDNNSPTGQRSNDCFANDPDRNKTKYLDYCISANRPFETLGFIPVPDNSVVKNITSGYFSNKNFEQIAIQYSSDSENGFVVSKTEIEPFNGRRPFTSRLRLKFAVAKFSQSQLDETSNLSKKWESIAVVDLNGDNLQDLVGSVSTGSGSEDQVWEDKQSPRQLWAAISNPTSQLTFKQIGLFDNKPTSIVGIDYNKDSRQDLSVIDASGKKLYLLFSQCNQGEVDACKDLTLSMPVIGVTSDKDIEIVSKGNLTSNQDEDFAVRLNDNNYSILKNLKLPTSINSDVPRFLAVEWVCPWKPKLDSRFVSTNQGCLKNSSYPDWSANPLNANKIVKINAQDCGSDCSQKINAALSRQDIIAVVLSDGVFPIGEAVNVSSLKPNGNQSDQPKLLIGAGKGKTKLKYFNNLYEKIYKPKTLYRGPNQLPGFITVIKAGVKSQVPGSLQCRGWTSFGREMDLAIISDQCAAVRLQGNDAAIIGADVDITDTETKYWECDDNPDDNTSTDTDADKLCRSQNDSRGKPAIYSILVGSYVIPSPCTPGSPLSCWNKPANQKFDTSRPPDDNMTVQDVSIKIGETGFGVGVIGSPAIHTRNTLLENIDCTAQSVGPICITSNATLTHAGNPNWDRALHSRGIPAFTQDPQQFLTIRSSGNPSSSDYSSNGNLCRTEGGYTGLRVAGAVGLKVEGCTFHRGVYHAAYLHTSDVGALLDVKFHNTTFAPNPNPNNKYQNPVSKPNGYHPKRIDASGQEIFLPHELEWINGALVQIIGGSNVRGCPLDDVVVPNRKFCLDRSSNYFLQPTASQLVFKNAKFIVNTASENNSIEHKNRIAVSESQGLTGALIFDNSQFVGGKYALRGIAEDIWEMRKSCTKGDKYCNTLMRNILVGTNHPTDPEPNIDRAFHTAKVIFNQCALTNQYIPLTRGPNERYSNILFNPGRVSTNTQIVSLDKRGDDVSFRIEHELLINEDSPDKLFPIPTPTSIPPSSATLPPARPTEVIPNDELDKLKRTRPMAPKIKIYKSHIRIISDRISRARLYEFNIKSIGKRRNVGNRRIRSKRTFIKLPSLNKNDIKLYASVRIGVELNNKFYWTLPSREAHVVLKRLSIRAVKEY